MIRFLLHRRIAVTMAFLAFVILGCVTYRTLPVSLLPDINIPHITVHVEDENMSARELESTVMAPLRRQLMQTAGLSDIKSEVRDGHGIVSLTLNYGVDTDLAFIEVNEKIDGTMNTLPRSLARPKAIKARATDIPALYIQLTPKSGSDEAFMEMAETAENIVRRRLEQLPQVAMADMTGMPQRIISIIPNLDKCKQIGILVDDIQEALIANNVEPGSMTVRDGYYEYNINVINVLRNVDDIKDIKIIKYGEIFTLSDFADVRLDTRQPQGLSFYNGKRAVTLALIKNSEENMADMKKAVSSVLDRMATEYPSINFSVTRDQSALLDFTISNLKQNLILGLLLVFLACILFMGDIRSSIIIGVCILVSVVLTFLLFYFFHISINIISMSGLILAVGMMIDNSVIVTENIIQFRQRGYELEEACIKGTNEMITPMLSSSLTTVAVFIPLIFMSGISGAIFSDQAFSITAGLAASYVVGIFFLPVLFYTIEKGKKLKDIRNNEKPVIKLSGIGSSILNGYDDIMDWCVRHRHMLMIITILTVPLCVILFSEIRRERIPLLDTDEFIAQIDWNENISLEQNHSRIEAITGHNFPISHYVASLGPQDYLISGDGRMTREGAELYIKSSYPDSILTIKNKMIDQIGKIYPEASVVFSNADNIFEKIFLSDEADLELRLHPKSSMDDEAYRVLELIKTLETSTGQILERVPMTQQLDIIIDREKLAVYNVDFSDVVESLRSSFRGSKLTSMRSFNRYTPVESPGTRNTIQKIISTGFVYSRPDNVGNKTEIPLKEILTIGESRDFKTITAGDAGEYIPVAFNAVGKEKETMAEIRKIVEKEGSFDVDFGGNFFSNSKIMNELCGILFVSIMLMYFILCAQFGSFIQPLIVLMEIPIDTAFALIALIILGHTLNLMSAIGIIVTCGIIVNDSILKIDSINELRKTGMPLMDAIHEAGRRRLRPIIMTSLTTIFAMLPVFLTSDLGSELQRPLAVAMINSMAIGTLVSIFIIPLFYRAIYRKAKL